MTRSDVVNEAARRFDVRSQDGTSLAVWVDGEAPALVMVHGSMADHTTFEPFVEVLREHLTTYAMDRRGFGASGDETIRTGPLWPVRLAAAHTVPRECRAEDGWIYPEGQFAAVTAPTLLLSGTDSVAVVRKATADAAAAIPHARSGLSRAMATSRTRPIP